jgi:hypothetical protein
MPVWINSSNDEPVKEFFTEVSSVKLVTKLIQVVLNHPFADHMVGLQVFFKLLIAMKNHLKLKLPAFVPDISLT